jgi:hypothetical protein
MVIGCCWVEDVGREMIDGSSLQAGHKQLFLFFPNFPVLEDVMMMTLMQMQSERSRLMQSLVVWCTALGGHHVTHSSTMSCRKVVEYRPMYAPLLPARSHYIYIHLAP